MGGGRVQGGRIGAFQGDRGSFKSALLRGMLRGWFPSPPAQARLLCLFHAILLSVMERRTEEPSTSGAHRPAGTPSDGVQVVYKQVGREPNVLQLCLEGLQALQAGPVL